MKYLTADDLIKRFGRDEVIQRLDHDQDGLVDEEVFNRYLEDVSAEIDFYLGQRYQTPLEIVSDVIVAIVSDLIRHRYFEPHPADHVVKAHNEALSKLKGISKGKLNLHDLELSSDPQSKSVGIHTAAKEPTPMASKYRGNMMGGY